MHHQTPRCASCLTNEVTSAWTVWSACKVLRILQALHHRTQGCADCLHGAYRRSTPFPARAAISSGYFHQLVNFSPPQWFTAAVWLWLETNFTWLRRNFSQLEIRICPCNFHMNFVWNESRKCEDECDLRTIRSKSSETENIFFGIHSLTKSNPVAFFE